MTTEVQELLARALQNLRDVKASHDPHQNLAFAHVEGVLRAFEDTHLLTGDEVRKWRDRVAEIHYGPAQRHRRTVPHKERVASRVRKVLLGPMTPEPFLDGSMRIVAVEIFDSFLRVHWNLSPLPGHDAVLGTDLSQLDRDTTGLDGSERQYQRDIARWTRLLGLVRFSIGDDVGTSFRSTKGHSGGNLEQDELTGLASFVPAPPPSATSIELETSGARFVLSLNPVSG